MQGRKVPIGIAAIVLTLAAAAVLLVTARGSPPRRVAPVAASVESGPVLEISCSSCGKPAVPVDGTVPAAATLAFAYRNPQGRKRLMVLAVDDRQQVYWYHPDPVRSPDSLKIDPTTTARGLPGEIAHTFAGERLTVVALFSDEPLFAGKVESLVDASGCASLRSLPATCLEQRLAVRR
jgi:hypothetical protein